MGGVSTPVRDEPPPAAPEELVLGPRLRRVLPRWFPYVALLVGVLVLATAAVWRFWPRPVEPLSLGELQDTYAGMVRADGTNDASVMTRQTVGESPLTVSPADCSPLVEMIMANHFPTTALDGVGTYWFGQGSTISLFTLRFADADAAARVQQQIAAALKTCPSLSVSTAGTQERALPVAHQSVRPTTTADDEQIGYVLLATDDVNAVQLMAYENTLTWQYRYESGSTSYSPLAADQLMSSLHSQLDAVVAARPH